MDFHPKPITKDGIPAALQKAERYRVINDPTSAESICLDVLAVSPENQQALVTLLLAITDQFGEEPTEAVRRAQQVLPRLRDEYKRTYYAGIISERRAKAQLRSGTPRSGEMASIRPYRQGAGRPYANGAAGSHSRRRGMPLPAVARGVHNIEGYDFAPHQGVGSSRISRRP